MNIENLQKQARQETGKEILAQKKKIISQWRNANTVSRAKIKSFYDKHLKKNDPEFWVDKKFNDFMGFLDELMRVYSVSRKKVNRQTQLASLIAINNNFYRHQYILDWFSQQGVIGENLNFQNIDPLALQVSVLGLIAGVSIEKNNQRKQYLELMAPGDRPNLENILNRNAKRDEQWIRQNMMTSFMRGDGQADMSRELSYAYGMIERGSLTTANTESHRNFNAGIFLAGALAAKRVLTERIIISTLDARTRPQSVAVDGLSDNGRGYFLYPGGVKVVYPGQSGIAAWDINDREQTRIQIVGVPNTARIGTNPVTGKTENATFNSFDEWAKTHGLRKNVYYQPITKPKVFEIANKQVGVL